jgi:hypothetical protein
LPWLQFRSHSHMKHPSTPTVYPRPLLSARPNVLVAGRTQNNGVNSAPLVYYVAKEHKR